MKFGLLTYRTSNLGDEIQSLASARFLPGIDYLIDRDSVGDFASRQAEPVATILNGWYSHRPESWPPSPSIHPLLVSMHFSPLSWSASGLSAADCFLREPAVRYLRANGPVGARDLYTLHLLRRRDVPAYFSGCLTLTLPPPLSVSRAGTVVLSDVPSEAQACIRARTERPLLTVSHFDTETPAGEPRFEKARHLLDIYGTAHCVVTTRLHCALPCLAMGTPVLFLETGQDPTRFPGLTTLLRRCTIPDLRSGRTPFDFEQPEPNAGDHLMLRSSLERTVERFVHEARIPEPASERPWHSVAPASSRDAHGRRVNGAPTSRWTRHRKADGGL